MRGCKKRMILTQVMYVWCLYDIESFRECQVGYFQNHEPQTWLSANAGLITFKLACLLDQKFDNLVENIFAWNLDLNLRNSNPSVSYRLQMTQHRCILTTASFFIWIYVARYIQRLIQLVMYTVGEYAIIGLLVLGCRSYKCCDMHKLNLNIKKKNKNEKNTTEDYFKWMQHCLISHPT